ncbi:MAG: sulfatase [Fuerstiella sp.]|nr:sulfatase [Fuerstiella sp.]
MALFDRQFVPVLVFAVCVSSALAADRPNIVFIFTDDHAPHAIGAYNGWLKKVNPTPNIDRLASQGMLFQNSFCTNSICGPSRAVIQTGKHSHLNGFMRNGNRFDGDQQTFPKLLRKAGYRTAITGKWHLGTDPQGFDYWKILPGQGAYYNPVFRSPSGIETIEGHCTDIVTDLALAWLEEQVNSDQPFMLMCQHKAPHRPWMPALRHLKLYDDIDIPEPATLFDDYEDNASPLRYHEMGIDRHLDLISDCFGPELQNRTQNNKSKDLSGIQTLRKMTLAQRSNWDAAFDPKNNELRKLSLSGREFVRWKYHRYIRNYLRCIKGIDESVGRLMNFLSAKGLDQNTIVIYSSDQGFFLGDHGLFDKRWMYEESMKMPMIVKWPGVTQPGAVNTDLIQNLDYAETFLDIAQAPVPDDMQGRSLVPLLKGTTPTDWRQSIYYHYYEYPSYHMVARHNGLRTEKYKLIHFYQFDEWEFYDLRADPDELKNEYANPRYADIVTRLKMRLVALKKEYRDDSDTSPLTPQQRRKFRPAG